MSYKTKQIFSYILGATLVMGGVVLAGSLTPSSYPSPSTHTLSDIYNKLSNNSYTASIPGFFSFPTGEASSTMRTIEEIWNAIPTISSSTIISGNTILGVAGAYNVSNLTPSVVASGTSYGVGVVGTMVSSGNLTYSDTFGPMTWFEANDYCSNNPLLGNLYNDNLLRQAVAWRLPSGSEISRVMKPDGWRVATTPSSYYWTSNLVMSYPSENYYVFLASRFPSVGTIEAVSGNMMDNTEVAYFRCVKNNY